MSINIAQAIKNGLEVLCEGDLNTPRLDVEVLLAHVLGMEREDLFTQFELELTQAQLDAFNGLLDRRKKAEPVARILGVKEFWSMDFILNEATLVPRPDSEALVEAVVERAKTLAEANNLKLLDLGTGTGCLLLSVLSELKEATGCGLDAEPKAIVAAKENAENLGLSDRSEFSQFNWLKDSGAVLENAKFDIIISNPPYIESGDIADLQREVAQFDPNLALDGGDDGLLHYRALAKFAKGHIKLGGSFFLEIGFGQSDDVCKIFTEQGWTAVATYKDLAEIERVLEFNFI